MMSLERPIAEQLADWYEGVGDLSFRAIIERSGITADEPLADLIEADGRHRLRAGLEIDIERYLEAIPDLLQRPDPLDAAIDMTLRRLADTGRVDEDAVAVLVASRPELESAIREAAALNNALWSTDRLQRRVAEWAGKELPCPFGPPVEDGRPRYQLRELLGSGAYGHVYLAIDRRLSEDDHDALVAIKVLPGGDRSPWGRQRLVDEATKARRIDHPNVVRVLDRGVSDEDEDFIVYEYVEGGDLGRRVRRRGGRLPLRDATAFAAKIARGVHAAHMAGLVHCDLKPNNILLTAQGEPKVADFGIAIRAGDPGSEALRGDAGAEQGEDGEATPLGNLAFMSPEQFRMEPGALTIPSDVYALGGTLFWMVTGDLPNGSTPEAIRRTHDPVSGRRVPPALADGGGAVDDDLESICRRAMAVRPDERYGSASLFADDLEAWLRREPIAWTGPSALRRLRLWSMRKPALAAATALIAVLIVGGGVVLGYLVNVAHRRELDAARAESERAIVAARNQAAQDAIEDHMASVFQMRDLDLTSGLLPQLWLLESLFGSMVLGDDDSTRAVLWAKRIELVGREVDAAVAAGRADELVTLLWEDAMAFWLIREGCADEAQPLIDRSLAVFERRLDPGDEWLGLLDAMRTCAEAGTLVERAAAGRPDPAAARALDFRLAELEARLASERPDTPLHLLVQRAQQALGASGLLDGPA